MRAIRFLSLYPCAKRWPGKSSLVSLSVSVKKPGDCGVLLSGQGNNSLNTGYRAALSLFNEQHILSHNDDSFVELDQHPSTERKEPHLESQGP